MENKKLVFFFFLYIHWVLYGPHTPWAVTHISSSLYSFMVPTFGKRLPQQWSCRNVRRWLTAQAGLSHCWFKEIYCWSVVNTHTHTHRQSNNNTVQRPETTRSLTSAPPHSCLHRGWSSSRRGRDKDASHDHPSGSLKETREGAHTHTLSYVVSRVM